MHIRFFEEKDREALQDIYLESRRNTFYWMDETLFSLGDFNRDTEGELIWVAVFENKPVGFISAWENDNFIHNLFVHPQSARQGIGSVLLLTCLNKIGRPAILKCLVNNIHAREFYLSKGWKIISSEDSPDGKYHLMHYYER